MFDGNKQQRKPFLRQRCLFTEQMLVAASVLYAAIHKGASLNTSTYHPKDTVATEGTFKLARLGLANVASPRLCLHWLDCHETVGGVESVK